MKCLISKPTTEIRSDERRVYLRRSWYGATDRIRKSFAFAEIEALSKIRSVFIPRLYDFSINLEECYAFSVLEWRAGFPLDTWPSFCSEQALNICRQCIQACCDLWRAGFCHLDLKPGNILFDGQHISLIDFEYSCEMKYFRPEDFVPRGTPGFAWPNLFLIPKECLTFEHIFYADLFSLTRLLLWICRDEESTVLRNFCRALLRRELTFSDLLLFVEKSRREKDEYPPSLRWNSKSVPGFSNS